MKQARIAFFSAILLSLMAGLAQATVTNQSTDAVIIEFAKENRSFITATVNPNQSVMIPEDAIRLRAMPRSARYGDETIKITIEEIEGKTIVLYNYDQWHEVGNTQRTKRTTKLPDYPFAINNSNVTTEVVVTKTNGVTRIFAIYPEQTAALPKDSNEIMIRANNRLWGDEIFNVDIVFPTGIVKNLNAPGRKVMAKDFVPR